MPQHVTVTDYDPRWPQKYEEEKEKIRHILGDDLVAIYHIGSTSVPGLAAKPIIDIMAAVKSLDRTDQKAGKFIQIGYEYLGEFGIAGRRYLRKGGDERTHQIHIFQAEDLSPHRSGIRSCGSYDGRRSRLCGSLHRHSLLSGHVRGEKRHCQYDHKRRNADKKDSCSRRKGENGDALRSLQRTSQTAGRRSRRYGDFDGL